MKTKDPHTELAINSIKAPVERDARIDGVTVAVAMATDLAAVVDIVVCTSTTPKVFGRPRSCC